MYKKYFQDVIGIAPKEVKISVGYELGGMSMFTYKESKRGYYAYVTPVERGANFESFMLFDGYKIMLKEVTRQSKKAEAEAEAMITPEYEQKLISMLQSKMLKEA